MCKMAKHYNRASNTGSPARRASQKSEKMAKIFKGAYNNLKKEKEENKYPSIEEVKQSDFKIVK